MQTKLYQNTQQNVKLSTINEFDQNILSSQPVFDQKIEFDFSNALKSVNIPNALFVNFFKGKNDEMFKFTKKQYKKLVNGNFDLENEYYNKPIIINSEMLKQRLLKIYNVTQGKKITEFSQMMYRLKHRKNSNLQLYVMDVDDKIEVCFIDIYHLGIFANDNDVTDRRKRSSENYEKNKLNDYCLSNLKK